MNEFAGIRSINTVAVFWHVHTRLTTYIYVHKLLDYILDSIPLVYTQDKNSESNKSIYTLTWILGVIRVNRYQHDSIQLITPSLYMQSEGNIFSYI